MALRVVATTHDGTRHVVEVENPGAQQPDAGRACGEKFAFRRARQIARCAVPTRFAQWWRLRDAGDLRPLIRLLIS